MNRKSKASFEGEVHAPFTGEIWHVRERHIRVPIPDCGYRSTLDEFVTSTGNPHALHVRKVPSPWLRRCGPGSTLFKMRFRKLLP